MIRNYKKISQLIGIIGGSLGLLFALVVGPFFSIPLNDGRSGIIYYDVSIILGSIVTILGGLVVNKTHYIGSFLMIAGGIGNIIGYGLSPAMIFGILFIYGACIGVGEPLIKNS